MWIGNLPKLASESDPCPHRDLQDHPVDPSANVAAPIRDGPEWPWLEKLKDINTYNNMNIYITSHFSQLQVHMME